MDDVSDWVRIAAPLRASLAGYVQLPCLSCLVIGFTGSFLAFLMRNNNDLLVRVCTFCTGTGKWSIGSAFLLCSWQWKRTTTTTTTKKKMQSIAPSPGWERVALHLALNNSASFLCLWCLILWCTSVHLFNPALKALNTCAYSVTSALWYANSR